VNEEYLALEYKSKVDFEKESFTTNEVIAAFTSCYGRLELYKYIKLVGQRVLYTDTDSIIFSTRKICKDNHAGSCDSKCYDIYPETGHALGEICSELPSNTHITHFASTGPKSYAYRCSGGQEVCKFKGVRSIYQNNKIVNFQGIRDLLFGGSDKSITLPPYSQFVHAKYEGRIFNVEQRKKLKTTFNKRVMLYNFDSLPFGYCDHENGDE